MLLSNPPPPLCFLIPITDGSSLDKNKFSVFFFFFTPKRLHSITIYSIFTLRMQRTTFCSGVNRPKRRELRGGPKVLVQRTFYPSAE